MRRSLAPLILALLAVPTASRAQPDDEGPTVLTLRPAGEPTPALKYTLLPEPRDLVPGNAALFYHRAIEGVLQNRYLQALEERPEGQERPTPPEDAISDWSSGPIDQIPRDEARTQLEHYRRVLREVELGALRSECDWGYDNRPETIELMIDEIQNSRSLARLVSLEVRLAILDGDTDGALHWLQAGYALARNVSRGPTIIQALVGLAIAGVMTNDLTELIQAEGTPGLYWAIAALPDPLVDMMPGLEGERSLLDRMLPDLRELDGPPWSVERARQFVDELERKLEGLSGDPRFDRWISRLGLTALFARAYPEAKRSLIAEGFTEAEVEAMPAVQAVGLFSYLRYRARNDDLYKLQNLPHWQSHRGLDEAYRITIEEKLANPGNALFAILSPNLSGVRVAQVRADRQLAALQCVEAVRLYAASHDGQLPPSLEAIDDAPPPIDPATGEPFGYEIDGGTATLTAPLIPGGPDHPLYRIRYELRLAE